MMGNTVRNLAFITARVGSRQKGKSWLWGDVDRLCDVPWDVIQVWVAVPRVASMRV